MTDHASASLVHQALTYAGHDEFVAATAPFARDGVRAGDRVFAVTTAGNIAALREALGDDADAVDFRDSKDWYHQPYQTLAAYDGYVDRHAGPGVVRIIGEPLWDGRSAASLREWARYESALNVAFASARTWIVCPYDVEVLPDGIVTRALQTHPEVIERATVRRSDRYIDPERFFTMTSADVTGSPPDHAARFRVEGDRMAAVRTFAAEQVARAGVDPDRVADAVVAVSELATNAVLYGREPVWTSVWRQGDDVVIEVCDAGDGFPDVLAGCAPTATGSLSGRGIWIVRQLADAVDVLRDERGFAVRMHLGAPRPSHQRGTAPAST